jgi:alpha 1,3-glucosidase
VRWYQAGSFTPFFRGHAHHDSKRREPWVYGDPHTATLRAVAITRYSLLPYWYTVFNEAYKSGVPVMRTMFSEFPDDEDTFALDDQWMVGSALLVKPVTAAGVDSVLVYLPGPQNWFDFYTLEPVGQSAKSQHIRISAPLDKLPVFIRGGSVVPRKMRLRRSSKLMYYDPITLVVVPDSLGTASGSLYMDDEHTLAHEKLGEFALRSFTFSDGVLICSKHPDSGPMTAPNTVERIVLASQSKAPVRVSLLVGAVATDLQFTFDAEHGTVTVKKPDAVVTSDWNISFEFA